MLPLLCIMCSKCMEPLSFDHVNLEKACHRVNREALWQTLRMYDVGSKLLNGIESIYFNSLACVRVKEVKASVLG